MFNLNDMIMVTLVPAILLAVVLNNLNVRNLVYGILINIVLFAVILKLLIQSLSAVYVMVFFLIFISVDLLIFFIYLYSKFTLSSVRQL